MKYAIILPDGAADERLPQLENRTPLEAAQTPHSDWVADHGVIGRVRTVPAGFTPATDVATLSIFGYDPARYYTGRAPLEAAAQGLTAGADEIIFRCNFVTVLDGRMKDFTADHIDQSEANCLIDDLNRLFADEPLRFYAGVSYRNLMIAGNAADMRLSASPPHDIPDRPVVEHLPQGAGADRVRQIMSRAAEMLADHGVNRARSITGRKPVTDIWLWGQGRPTQLDPFQERFGLRGAAITGVDIIRGLAVCMGMQLIEVRGATGYIDTNYVAKGKAAVDALHKFDLVVVHVEAPDEAGHLADAQEKVLALERIDRHITGPLLNKLRTFDQWRMLIAPDHPTPVTTTAHSAEPPPFCYAGTGVGAGKASDGFCEPAAEASGVFIAPGHQLIHRFLQAD